LPFSQEWKEKEKEEGEAYTAKREKRGEGCTFRPSKVQRHKRENGLRQVSSTSSLCRLVESNQGGRWVWSTYHPRAVLLKVERERSCRCCVLANRERGKRGVPAIRESAFGRSKQERCARHNIKGPHGQPQKLASTPALRKGPPMPVEGQRGITEGKESVRQDRKRLFYKMRSIFRKEGKDKRMSP